MQRSYILGAGILFRAVTTTPMERTHGKERNMSQPDTDTAAQSPSSQQEPQIQTDGRRSHSEQMNQPAQTSQSESSHDGKDEHALHTNLKRGMESRHLQMISLGGVIGTGLFLGSGKSISLTGPSIIFVYILVGVIMFFLMRAIGEMMYRDPSQHTFINFITRYLGNGWGHFAGWTYWAALVLLGMTEITAVSTYFITFFDTFGIDLTHWKWLIELCFLVSLVSINLIAVKVFGEVEFWFSMIKITLICAMIATAVVMIVIGYHYPAVQIHGVDHVSPAGHAGFDNLFANFSFAPNGWMAFLMSFQMVFFAYEMIEFVGVTVSETKNPRKVLPKAINEIIVRWPSCALRRGPRSSRTRTAPSHPRSL